MSFQVACATTELDPEGALQVILADSAGTNVPVAVVRDSDGSWHAIGDTCSHQNYSLAEGDVEDGTIECWKHGAPFDLATGNPLSLPATKPVPVYSIEINDGDVLVDVDVTL